MIPKTTRLPLLVLLCLALISPACSFFLSPWEWKEIDRITSPDTLVDAVWTEGSGGATTGYYYKLYLVPRGLKFDPEATSFEYPIFAGDHLNEFKVIWKDPKLLELHFKRGRVGSYRNYWRYWNPDAPQENNHHVVETRLIHTGEGSMLHENDRK